MIDDKTYVERRHRKSHLCWGDSDFAVAAGLLLRARLGRIADLLTVGLSEVWFGIRMDTAPADAAIPCRRIGQRELAHILPLNFRVERQGFSMRVRQAAGRTGRRSKLLPKGRGRFERVVNRADLPHCHKLNTCGDIDAAQRGLLCMHGN
jgi:hypothetical protein